MRRLIVAACVAAAGCDAAPTAAGPPAVRAGAAPGPARAEPEAPRTGVGDAVSLGIGGGPGDVRDGATVFVRGVPPAAWKDYRRFALAKDDYGLRQLAEARDAYLIEPGTGGTVLGLDAAGFDLRVTDGRFEGREFWVLKENVLDAKGRPAR